MNVDPRPSTSGSWTPGSRSGRSCDACVEEFRIADYDIVGFTTTFEQNLASLALSRLIKERWPDKAIVFGGGNCEGEMGRELHRSFPWIDYVCSGEGERSFPQLVDAIAAGRDGAGIPGIVYRRDGRSTDNGRGEAITDMDAVPAPNYDEYFAAVKRSPLVPALHPSLLIETSRGCWWGAKAHCTFCGLNGATMTFRSKSAERVLGELEGFRTRYPTEARGGGRQHPRHALFPRRAAAAARPAARFHPLLRDQGESDQGAGAAAA